MMRLFRFIGFIPFCLFLLFLDATKIVAFCYVPCRLLLKIAQYKSIIAKELFHFSQLPGGGWNVPRIVLIAPDKHMYLQGKAIQQELQLFTEMDIYLANRKELSNWPIVWTTEMLT